MKKLQKEKAHKTCLLSCVGFVIMGGMLKKLFADWNKLEIFLLIFGVTAVTVAFFLGEERDLLSLFTSCFGVVGVLFVAKGLIAGQWLCIVFVSLYACMSFRSQYYGELILVLCFTLPSNVAAIVTWLKHPSKDARKVEVNTISKAEWAWLALAVVVCTVGAYFLLKALNTAEVVVSTISFITSIFAAYLLIRRSEYYAVFYILNDIILIVLWSLALFKGAGVLPSIISYCAFLCNDLYGFFDWRKRSRQQRQKAYGQP